MPNIQLEIVGMKDFLRACGEQRRDMAKVLTQASMKTARRVVVEAQGRAQGDALSAKVARTVKAANSRYPTIVAGGTRTVMVTRRRGGAKTRPKAGEVFFGSEFGGGQTIHTRQFRPHKGIEGYWLWPTIRKMNGEIADIYMDSLDQVLTKLAKGAK